MTVPASVQRIYHRLVDRIFADLPQPLPSLVQLRHCRIVSHRGEHRHRMVPENTLAAFDAAYAAGVWGIECDVRWTRDLQPVVSHDRDCGRLFGTRAALSDLSWKEVRDRIPLIPSLREVIQRYGKRLHLMVELKDEPYPEPLRQSELLAELFAGLQPARDFHLLSLDPAMFRHCEFVPTNTLLPIAEANLPKLSNLAIERGYAGVAGHYLLLTRARIRRHQALRQQVGTGFVTSRNCLYRELRRGVDWIFSDYAAGLQGICRELLRTLEP